MTIVDTLADTPVELPFPAGAPKDLKVSFEFFPPKTEKMAETLWSSIKRLEPLGPRFVSVTYGADGSTRERTHDAVDRIIADTDLTPAPHLTCIGSTHEKIRDLLNTYMELGVNRSHVFLGQISCLFQNLRPDALERVVGRVDVFDLRLVGIGEA